MGYYKFLHSKDIHHVVAGETIRLSTVSHYRELDGGEQSIADRLEGSVAMGIRDLALEKLSAYTQRNPSTYWWWRKRIHQELLVFAPISGGLHILCLPREPRISD